MWTGPVLSRQEMFNRAFLGLQSQGWKRALTVPWAQEDVNTGCVYQTEESLRCGWGWVDPENTPGHTAYISGLRERGVGLAAVLSPEDLAFAQELQKVHDNNRASELERAMRNFATHNNLTVPG